MTERNSYSQVKSKLGLRIAALRAKADVSQRQFALNFGVDRSTLNAIESGKGNPEIETLVRIANGLDIDFDELFRDEEDGRDC